MDVSLTLNADDTWQVGTRFDIEWSCDSGCSTDELVVFLPTATSEETATLTGALTLPSGAPQALAGGAAAEDGTILSWTLAETVDPGDILTVELSYTKVQAGTTRSLLGCLLQEDWIGPLCTFSYGNPTTGEDLEGAVLMRLPAMPVDRLTQTLNPTTTFDLSATATMAAPVGIAPGAPDATWQTYGPWTGVQEDAYTALVFPALVQDLSVSGSGSHQVYGWTDTLTSLLNTDWLRRSGPDDSLVGDLDWLEDRFGPLPQDLHMVLMQTNHDAGIDEGLGIHVPGIAIVLVEDTSGDFLAGGDHEADALHELAHAWIGLGSGTAVAGEQAGWLLEGATTLLEWERYPAATTSIPADQVPYFYNPTGLPNLDAYNYDLGHVIAESINVNWCFHGESVASLERGEPSRLLHYQMGAYVLSQALFTHLGKGGDEDSFWSAVADVFATGDHVDAATVETLLTSTLGLPAFYDQWISAEAYGVPMMYLREFTWGEDDSDADSVRIGQAQQVMYDAAAACPFGEMQPFDDVPFFLRCFADSDPDAVVFHECQASAGSLHDPLPYLFDTGPDAVPDALIWIPLTAVGSVAGDQPLPAHFGVVADDMLFPGQVPTAGLDNRASWDVWRAPLFCTPDQVDAGACGDDDDLDDAPDSEGDCDPTDATANPEQQIDLLAHAAGNDNNCDQWIGEYP